MRTLETYRGINIIEYQDQHHAAGDLSIGYVPPERGKYGALEGGPAATVETIKATIDELLDKKTDTDNEAKTTEHTNELMKCDCGHSIPKSIVMSANLGTACPDCYDRMSD